MAAFKPYNSPKVVAVSDAVRRASEAAEEVMQAAERVNTLRCAVCKTECFEDVVAQIASDL